MELSSRQLIVLAAPLVVTYLTYSTVDRGANLVRAVSATQAAVSSKSRSTPRAGGVEARNPFSPVSAGAAGGILSAVLDQAVAAGPEESAAADAGDGLLMTLNGTVIAPRWRFAIIDGQRVIEGQRYMGLKVEKIDAEMVTLSDLNGTPVELELQIAKVVAPAEEAVAGGGSGGFADVDGAAPPDILDLLGIPRS